MDNGELSLPTATPGPLVPAASSTPGVPLVPGAHPSGSPFGQESERPHPIRSLRKRMAAVGALIAKFFAAIKGVLLLLPKVKLLTTAGTALVSVVLYSLVFGWWFAVGFVVLLFVHEMGHVIQLRREGIRATAPVFVPFLGAVVGMKQMPKDALAEARVGLAGPILGTAGAAVCLLIAQLTNSPLLRALAYVGFFLNLINLVPLVPFDGGRAMAAMAPVMWFIGLGVMVSLLLVTHNSFLLIFVLFGGLGVMVVLLLVTRNPFLLIFVLLGGMETYRRWKLRGTRSLEQAAYYRVSPRHRMMVGIVYIGLMVVLVLGMIGSEVLHYGSHTFHVA
jgi:Zn-dependent protease